MPVQKYWSVGLKGLSVGNNALSINATSAVFDSGTHFIIASDADARIINGVSALSPSFQSHEVQCEALRHPS